MATGSIKWFGKQGFGFIVDDEGQEVFFHISNSAVLKGKESFLVKGAAVDLEKRPSTKKGKEGTFEAHNVRLREMPRSLQTLSATEEPQPTTSHFHNPYTFVPTPPRGHIAPDQFAGDYDPVMRCLTHSSLQLELWTGCLPIKLTTVTPLLLPDVGDKERKATEHQTYDMLDYLPESALRGMLRSAYEVVTNSRYISLIDLAEIPFIRLRGVMSDWLRQSGGSYGAMVQRAQEDLDLLEAAHTLRINLRQKTVTVANRRIELTERELFLYALLAYLRQQGRGDAGYVTLDEITVDDLDAVFRRLTAARGNERGLDDAELVARFGFLDKLAARVDSTDARVREDIKKTFEQAMSRIKKRCEDARLPEHYQLTTRGERGALRYGLEVAPERIVWEGAEP